MATASDRSASPTSEMWDLISAPFTTCSISPKSTVSSLCLADPKPSVKSDQQAARAKTTMGLPTIAPQPASGSNTTKMAATQDALPAKATTAISSEDWDLIVQHFASSSISPESAVPSLDLPQRAARAKTMMDLPTGKAFESEQRAPRARAKTMTDLATTKAISSEEWDLIVQAFGR
mmetsp:Transcript_44299/g.60075  ORF Transcript_44299/g.60075 Transcript_44299/m.60075 type:complete len:177 (-) Transcript_44299:170-700(-)